MSLRDRIFGNPKKLNEIENATLDLERKTRKTVDALRGDDTVRIKNCIYCASKNPDDAAECWNCKNAF